MGRVMYFLHKPLSYQFQRIHYKNHSDTPTNTPQEIRVFYALIHLECWQRNDLLLLKGSLAPDPGALAEHACPFAGSIPANLRSRWNLDACGGVGPQGAETRSRRGGPAQRALPSSTFGKCGKLLAPRGRPGRPEGASPLSSSAVTVSLPCPLVAKRSGRSWPGTGGFAGPRASVPARGEMALQPGHRPLPPSPAR